MGIKQLFGKDMVGLWTRDLAITTIAVFLMRFGEGVINGVRMNFFVDTLGITGAQVLWLEGIREAPGLLLIFIAALIMRLPLSWRAAGAALILGLAAVGYAVIRNAMLLAGIYVVIRLAHILNLGLNVYAHEKAPAEELNPTLAAGVSFDHISSVGMPFIFGAMMAATGEYAQVYWLAAALIGISVVFVLRMQSGREPQPTQALAMAE